MQLPDLDELIQLRHQARGLSNSTAQQRVATPLSGLYASVFRGQGMDFDEVREYREGDEIRQIDWRVTARTGKPYLKVYREERERQVMLCVDASAPMHFGTQKNFKIVQAAKLAALLGWSAQGHGDRVGGVVCGQQHLQLFRPSPSAKSFLQLLRCLQTPPINASQYNLPYALRALSQNSATGALVFVISDFHHTDQAQLKTTLSQLRQQHEVVLIQLTDQRDHTLPAMGKVSFHTASGEKITIDTDDVTGQQHYQQHWETQQQQLQQLASDFFMDLLNVTTNDDAYQCLLSGLRQRAHQQHTHR